MKDITHPPQPQTEETDRMAQINQTHTPVDPAEEPDNPSFTPVDSQSLTDRLVALIMDKKGEDVLVMKMDEITQLCDYFIVVTGNSRVHNRAMAEYIDMMMKEEKLRGKIQGKEDGGWILLDYGAIVIHLFTENLRNYYDLETLWKKAPSRMIQYPIKTSAIDPETSSG